jgi:hypothetical protein
MDELDMRTKLVALRLRMAKRRLALQLRKDNAGKEANEPKEKTERQRKDDKVANVGKEMDVTVREDKEANVGKGMDVSGREDKVDNAGIEEDQKGNDKEDSQGKQGP